jgi:hypothetical protein
MKLYYSEGSPFARKVRIVLAEKGLAFESDVANGLRPAESASTPAPHGHPGAGRRSSRFPARSGGGDEGGTASGDRRKRLGVGSSMPESRPRGTGGRRVSSLGEDQATRPAGLDELACGFGASSVPTRRVGTRFLAPERVRTRHAPSPSPRPIDEIREFLGCAQADSNSRPSDS